MRFFDSGGQFLLASVHQSDFGDYDELGSFRSPVEYRRYGRTGRPLGSLVALPGEEYYRGAHPDGSGFTFTPSFGVRPWAATGPTSWFWGRGDAFEIQEWSPEGDLLKIIRLAKERRPMPTEIIQEREERLREMAPEPAAIQRAVPLPDLLPAHEQILVDQLGNVWMAEYVVLDEEPRWSVFDPSGRWLGEVAIPARGRITDIGDDYLVGVWRDDLDVETVRMYRLDKPKPAGPP